MNVEWITSTGGPIVAIPSQYVRLWSGAFGKDGRLLSWSGELVGHYGLACQVEDVGVIAVPHENSNFPVLVLWGEPLPAWVIPELSVIVQCYYADSDESPIRLIFSSFSDVGWSPIGEMEISEGMKIFDAVASGAQLDEEDHLEFPAIPGESVVEVDELSDEETSVRLVRLRSRKPVSA